MANPIPVGTHDVSIVDTYLGKAQTGTPFVAIVVEDGESNRLTWYGYLSEKAVSGTVDRLVDIGWDADAADWQIDSLSDGDLMRGKPCQVVVEDEEYDGKIRRKVKYLNPVGGGSPREAMDAKEARSFSAELRKSILAKRGPKPVATRGSSKPAVPARTAPASSASRTATENAAKTDQQFDDDLPI